LTHCLRAMSDYNGHPSWLRKFSYIKNMEKERFAANFMQHLRQAGFHPSALARRQDYDAQILHLLLNLW
jgi:hypothetical protein